jgi:glutathione S-transferase
MAKPSQPAALFVSLFPSTDAEFVRWVLWHYGIEYEEQPHPPIFQALVARRLAGSAMTLRRAFTADSNAVVTFRRALGTNAAETIAPLWPRDTIANYFEAICADRRLVPPGAQSEVDTWWKDYAYGWGWSVARWCYYYLLPHKPLMMPALAGGRVPPFERTATSLLYPVIARFLRRDMQLSPALAAQDLATIKRWFDRMDPAFARGQRFVSGDTFTLADLLFVSYGGPLVFPEGYGAPLPRIDQLPAAMRPEVEAFRARPTGQYLLRMYALKTSGRAAAQLGV